MTALVSPAAMPTELSRVSVRSKCGPLLLPSLCRDREIDAQFPDVLLLSRRHGNRERAPLTMVLQNLTNPRKVPDDLAIARNTQTGDLARHHARDWWGLAKEK